MTASTPERPLIVATNRFRAQILARERVVAVRLVNAYGRAYSRLRGDIAALETAIGELGEAATWGQVQRLTLYKQLLAQIRDEVSRFGVIADNEINDGARAAIEAGLADSMRAIQLALPGLDAAQVRGLVNTLVPDQVETMLGFLSQDSPLYANLKTLGDDVATVVSQKLSEAIILGMNPRVIAREIADATGQGLTWSLNMSRTSQLWAYREASRSNYLANSHVVRGWTWWAQLGDPRTCFPKGTMITTSDGERPVESIKVNDLVLTGSGNLKRVTETMRRSYMGDMITIKTNAASLTCTGDHPILVKRGDDCYWVEARNIRGGDIAIRARQANFEELNHIVANISIKRGVGESQNSIAFTGESQGLSGIGIMSASMPINAVDLQSDIKIEQVEVNGIPVNRSFLNIPDAKLIKTQPSIFLWFGFFTRSAVAYFGAILSFVCWNVSEFSSAILTNSNHGKTAARFATMLKSCVSIKYLTASLASFRFPRLLISTFNATDYFLSCFGRSKSKRFSTDGTTLSDHGCYSVFGTTCTGAKSTTPTLDERRSEDKFFSAHLTRNILGIWICPKDAEAFTATGFRSWITSEELLGANRAGGKFHAYIVTQEPITYTNTSYRCEHVFNLEIEGDHTYFANDLLVHNCMSCVAMHGTEHTLDEALDDHHAGRCTMLPITLSARELGLNVSEETQTVQSGEEWFRSLSREKQIATMGASKWKAWNAGEFDFAQLSEPYQNDVYGQMRREASLKGLIGERAKEYYQSR